MLPAIVLSHSQVYLSQWNTDILSPIVSSPISHSSAMSEKERVF